MPWINEMFHTQKPIIAMLHLDALPGDPAYRRDSSMAQIVEHARRDLHALQDGGVDGVLISNEFSL
ncbi:MAG: SgcQ protein, partial [Firmicutes bacterium]|nr:SgcQ protein [Bacillota bacterium]